MKAIKRLSPPDCLNNDIPATQNKKLKFYKALYDSAGNVRPRWNTSCQSDGKISDIRKKLLEMSNNTCVYCGVKLSNKTLEVDHFLPKASPESKYLAYCWENLLPACHCCNHTKSNFMPESLKEQKIIENILQNDIQDYDLVYDKQTILSLSEQDRLIDPTFDNPSEHFEFNPEFYEFIPKTDCGKITCELLFNRHEEIAEKLENISLMVKDLCLKIQSRAELIESIQKASEINGYEFVYEQFLTYWLQEKETGNIYRI
ncbi:HNH endonuclease signature motif containing protein [Candidatus Albibeggiatoa sp. nov. BB20]|uniref:HNH endonuclease n=1 Tax=Candidatus Albibeggiatoa sp. nov. BB20 TaxID=3162723 RepID=UPI0033657C0C